MDLLFTQVAGVAGVTVALYGRAVKRAGVVHNAWRETRTFTTVIGCALRGVPVITVHTCLTARA